MAGRRSLEDREAAVAQRLGAMPVDFAASAAVSNLYRAASAIRNHLEQTVLRRADLTWTGFVVLWVVWVWEAMETRHVAEEAGISKGTLTGVVNTLEARGLIERRIPDGDRRLVELRLTEDGRVLMEELYPVFNAEEAFVVSALRTSEQRELTEDLRRVVAHVEQDGGERQEEGRRAPRIPGAAVGGRSRGGG